MKKMKDFLLCISIMMLICLTSSCSKDKPTESKSKASPICFTVDGFKVTVHNMWSDSEAHTVNMKGFVSFNSTVSRNNETHKLEWTNIISDYITVLSFDVRIDGRDYSYPKDKCGPKDEISFKLNDKLHSYKESWGSRHHPYGYYVEANDSIPEQYVIVGSKTTADYQANKNRIIIGFVKNNRWDLLILYYDENGNTTDFCSLGIDISILTNKDTVGAQMSASIPGPLESGDNTLSGLVFLVERVR
ncbi:MAG: hypothetical protein KAW16_01155 [candidate division Zixibacteria bacterium]|nr:hypothetical protein [candidate division Zixibacteria bacterium]